MLIKIVAGYFLLGLIQAAIEYFVISRSKNRKRQKELDQTLQRNNINIGLLLAFLVCTWPLIDLLWVLGNLFGKKILSGKGKE